MRRIQCSVVCWWCGRIATLVVCARSLRRLITYELLFKAEYEWRLEFLGASCNRNGSELECGHGVCFTVIRIATISLLEILLSWITFSGGGVWNHPRIRYGPYREDHWKSATILLWDNCGIR
ncbi:hypothetical protein DEU56DRAFT_838866 [Suillus clintonianus]|uniref:uncharacterized protein n=1 Tax=Suillus clintonianus TaxID=1904413 RepID=UPI001B8669DB|nr:uncharacterized protein DEU56DRAFT_838866 [Suillus clintonianus]KAG2117757.1 hypothetical protein DEU56DRAFT_838866 [Suillus clintonianus]